MIPNFGQEGLLPPGVHPATWDAVEARFGGNASRTRLFDGLCRAARSLRDAGCTALYLDGSFVTAKDIPGDYDACWDTRGVSPDILDPILLTFDPGRLAQKLKFRGELFPASAVAEPVTRQTYLDFFQTDKSTGRAKGIVLIDPRELA